MPGISELLIILLIVALLFGTGKLRSMGGDLGSAIQSFRSAVHEEEGAASADEPATKEAQDEAAARKEDSSRGKGSDVS